jgi:hypothetical protein
MNTAPRTKTNENEPFTEEMRQIMERAQKGDASVLAELREMLDNHPELWQQLGDLARHLEEALLNMASGPSLLARESIRRRLTEIKEELAGLESSPLETLIIDRIGISWLQVHLADLDAAQAEKAGNPTAYQQVRRQNGAQNRYLAGIKQLAAVRKLLRASLAPLQLLRFPVDEKANTGEGEGVGSSRRKRITTGVLRG